MADSIQIDRIRVSGFRGIRNIEVSLSRITVLIGANNSGKTSLLKALQLALGDYSRHISEEDFFIGTDERRASEIIVDVRFIPVDSEGKHKSIFNEVWRNEFGERIKAEANGDQFVAIRTRVKRNEIKGEFERTRSVLHTWPGFNNWKEEKLKEDETGRLSSVPLIAIEAQRDIHYELRDKTSLVGKVLSNVEYAEKDVTEIEDLIRNINQEAVKKSSLLQDFKSHLEQLNQSFEGAGNVEITPFPKKIRDLSKHFSIHFGESENGAFSMEYHGMGTRSWASMLTAQMFIETIAAKHEQEEEPFFPILAAEEPEAHLHPNAQKTLYCQLARSKRQVIVSTHSPYFAAMADIADVRALRKDTLGISEKKLAGNITAEDKKILAREITSKRGEILFAKVLLLCEGITEEQLIPAMFDICEGKSLFSLGICCINVGGKNYPPFVRLAYSLGILTYIISDNDGCTKIDVEKQLRHLREKMQNELGEDVFGISYLSDGNDFEAELLTKLSLKDEIIEALVLSETNASENEHHRSAKLKEIQALPDDELLKKMRKTKASYAGFLADVIRLNPNKKDPTSIVPTAVFAALNQIKKWFAL